MQGARVWQSPSQCFQHAGLIKEVGPITRSTFPKVERAAVITSKRATNTESGKQLISGFKAPLVFAYEEECHRGAVESLVSQFKAEGIDHVIAFGGGKIIDVG